MEINVQGNKRTKAVSTPSGSKEKRCGEVRGKGELGKRSNCNMMRTRSVYCLIFVQSPVPDIDSPNDTITAYNSNPTTYFIVAAIVWGHCHCHRGAWCGRHGRQRVCRSCDHMVESLGRLCQETGIKRFTGVCALSHRSVITESRHTVLSSIELAPFRGLVTRANAQPFVFEGEYWNYILYSIIAY